MTALRPVRCDQRGEVCNYADEMGPAYAERQCGCYRELPSVPKCCGTCRYWVRPEHKPTHFEGSMCLSDKASPNTPCQPPAWGLCGYWEKQE